jgi:uncharacterized RmlC-like cupin family protein
MEATAIEALRAEVAASRHDELRYVPMFLPHKKTNAFSAVALSAI